MSAVAEVLQETLRQLGDRRRKLEPFVDELAEIDIVERDLRKTVAKLRKRGRGPQTAAPSADAPERVRANGNGSEAADPTNGERLLQVLGEHPRGLAMSVLAREAGITANSCGGTLERLRKGGQVERLGRGFYRLPQDNGDGTREESEREPVGAAGQGA